MPSSPARSPLLSHWEPSFPPTACNRLCFPDCKFSTTWDARGHQHCPCHVGKSVSFGVQGWEAHLIAHLSHILSVFICGEVIRLPFPYSYQTKACSWPAGGKSHCRSKVKHEAGK